MFRKRTLITYLGVYLIAASTVVRFVAMLRGDPYLLPVSGLLAVILVLMALEPWLFRRAGVYAHLYLAVQTGLVIVLAMLPPANDFFAFFFFSLALQAMNALDPRRGFRWISVFAAVMGVFVIDAWGWAAGGPLVLIYAAGCLCFGSYAAVFRQAENTRRENQRLLVELEAAHRQLQAYTSRAEELAAIQERNRLAHDLHDSVSQTIFSLTLMAEAVRILFVRDAHEAASLLDKLQDLAKSALGEMRSLVYELRTSDARTLEEVPVRETSTTGG